MTTRVLTIDELVAKYGATWVRGMIDTAHKSHLEIINGQFVTMENLKEVLGTHGDPLCRRGGK